MKAIKRLLSLSLVLLALTLVWGNTVKAVQNDVTVKYDVVSNDSTSGNYQGVLGGTATIDKADVDFFIHNGQIVDAENNSFLVSKSNKIIVVKDSKDVYIDTNGDLLKKEATPEKPGFEFVEFFQHPENEKVFVATYKLADEDAVFEVTIGDNNPVEYQYNEVVELDEEIANFKYWADEDGQVVSTNLNYKFTVLGNVTLNAVTDKDVPNTPVVYLSNVSGIRADSKSFLGYLDKTEGLIEYGILASNKEEVLTFDTINVEVIPSRVLNPNTNEFLRSIKDTEDFTTFRAYAIYEDDVVVYSDNIFFIIDNNISYQTDAEDITIAYADKSKNINGEIWNLNDVFVNTGDLSDKKNETKSFRLRSKNKVISHLYTEFSTVGINKIEFNHAHYGNHTEGKINISVSKDKETWINILSNLESTDDLKLYVLNLNYQSKILVENDINEYTPLYVKFYNINTTSSNQSVNIDDIKFFKDVDTKLYQVTFNNDGILTKNVVRYGEKVTQPSDPQKSQHTFEGWMLNDSKYDFESLVKSNITLVADYKEIPLAKIEDVLGKVGEEVIFEGVVTGFTALYQGKYNKVWLEDETGAITLYNLEVEGLEVGNKYKIIGDLEEVSGLKRVVVTSLEYLGKESLLEPLLIDDLTSLDLSLQAHRVTIENLIIKEFSSTGQELTLTLDGKDILVRAISASGEINNLIKTGIVGQKVNLHGVHVDIYDTVQLLPINIEQIELIEMTDQDLLLLALRNIEELYEDVGYLMGDDFNLETSGLHDTSIIWDESDYIVDGKWFVEESKSVILTGKIILNKLSEDFIIEVYILYVDPEAPNLEEQLVLTENFEHHKASSSYQGTVITGNEGQTWTTYYGTPTTTNPLNGNISVQMRVYADDNIGFLKTNFKTNNLRRITFNAKVSNVNVGVKVQVSKDNENTWINPVEYNFNNLTVVNLEYVIPIELINGDFIIKFELTRENKVTSSNQQLTIDDIKFFADRIVLSDEAKIDETIATYKNTYDNLEVLMDTYFTLPTNELLHDAVIVWTQNNYIVDGKYIIVTENTNFELVGTVTIGEKSKEIKLNVTIKYVVITERELLYHANFENSSAKSAWAEGDMTDTYESENIIWKLNNALRGNDSDDKNIGKYGLRIRKGGIALLDKSFMSVSEIEFYYAHFGTLDAGRLSMQVSIDKEKWVTVWDSPNQQVSESTKYNIIFDYTLEELVNNNITLDSEIFIRWITTSTTGNDNNNRQNLDEIKIFR